MELRPAQYVAVGAAGKPGRRTFFITARGEKAGFGTADRPLGGSFAAGDSGRADTSDVGPITRSQVWLKCEKIHVELLALKMDELLAGIEAELGRARPRDLASLLELLEDPSPPTSFDWEVGEMGLGYDAEDDLVLLVVKSLPREDLDIDSALHAETEEITEEIEEAFFEELGDEAGGEELRIWMTRSQAEVLAVQAARVAASGRKPCPICSMPMDPDGHECFGGNGHKRGRLVPGPS